MKDNAETQSDGENNKLDTERKQQAEADNIQELRERLYSRGSGSVYSTRHSIPKRQGQDVSKHQPDSTLEKDANTLVGPTPVPAKKEYTEPKDTHQAQQNDKVEYNESMPKKGKRSSFRKAIIIFGILFFVVAIVISGMSMFMGNHTISGDNISIKTSGPVSVGGGEEYSFQVSVSNQNTVPIKSATLIVEYPRGTQSIDEPGKEIIIERTQLDTIDSNELVNIPLSALVYGEEDDEKEILVSIEYRVEGSNATFEKEATPLRFKMSTSPIVMELNTVENISSGQELELEISLQSNSPTPLSDILVKAEYPQGFDFIDSEPSTASGEDTWQFSELNPNEKHTVSVRGLVTGEESEILNFYTAAGVASEKNKNELASKLANAQAEVYIEQPFIDLSMAVNGNNADVVVVDEKTNASVEIVYKNTLDTALYDGKVAVELGGNALDEYTVRNSNGYYDSNTNTIVWDSSDEPRLEEILPGTSVLLTFTLDPRRNVGRAPKLTLDTTVSADRGVFSDSSSQELVGIVSKTIKVESVPELIAATLYENGPFTNSGPTPPVAGEVTQYTYALQVEAGANDLTDAELIAVIPHGVSWLDLTNGDDTITYNSTTREIKWTIGDMDSRSTKEIYAQVSLKPSVSQIGSTPTLLQSQKLKAVDRFTGTTIRVTHPALTTSLSEESDELYPDSKVQDPKE